MCIDLFRGPLNNLKIIQNNYQKERERIRANPYYSMACVHNHDQIPEFLAKMLLKGFSVYQNYLCALKCIEGKG